MSYNYPYIWPCYKYEYVTVFFFQPLEFGRPSHILPFPEVLETEDQPVTWKGKVGAVSYPLVSGGCILDEILATMCVVDVEKLSQDGRKKAW